MKTQLNNSFSIARMWRLMVTSMTVDRYELLLQVGVFALAINLFYMYQFLTLNLFDGQSVSFWVKTMSLITLIKMVVMIYTGVIFSDYHQKEKANRSLLVPLSQAEQWGAKVLQSLMSFVVFYAIFAVIVLGWLWLTGSYEEYVVQFKQFELLGFSPMSLFGSLFSAFFIWCLCVAIAIFFRRRQRLICLSYFIFEAVLTLFLPRFMMFDEYTTLLVNLLPYRLVLMILFAVGLIASFFRFKRLQIYH